jgi:hypothetical protein
LVEFASVVDAVRCAVDVQREMAFDAQTGIVAPRFVRTADLQQHNLDRADTGGDFARRYGQAIGFFFELLGPFRLRGGLRLLGEVVQWKVIGQDAPLTMIIFRIGLIFIVDLLRDLSLHWGRFSRPQPFCYSSRGTSWPPTQSRARRAS